MWYKWSWGWPSSKIAKISLINWKNMLARGWDQFFLCICWRIKINLIGRFKNNLGKFSMYDHLSRLLKLFLSIEKLDCQGARQDQFCLCIYKPDCKWIWLLIQGLSVWSRPGPILSWRLIMKYVPRSFSFFSGSVSRALDWSSKFVSFSLTASGSFSKTFYLLLSSGSTQEDLLGITEKLLSGTKESNQTKILFRLIQEGLLLVTSKSMCTEYWSTS